VALFLSVHPSIHLFCLPFIASLIFVLPHLEVKSCHTVCLLITFFFLNQNRCFMDIYSFSLCLSVSSSFYSPTLLFCLPTSLNHHKFCHCLTSSLPVCLYSLFVAEEQSILFKETPEKWDICLSTHTHTHTERHHNHGRSRTHEKERRERWMFTFLWASASLIGQMNDFIVCVFPSLPFSVFLFNIESGEGEVGNKERQR